ncbi:hypothetical protein Pan97_14650 [Bremerella volcania]|uniref:Uncharacterized protein n=1 Tax=Bremerella volcania TaxID=2527984 RepID=A0A518C5F4_9BACT|nr:hypothetical protein Pan97_14650 [Bremerella volcania]
MTFESTNRRKFEKMMGRVNSRPKRKWLEMHICVGHRHLLEAIVALFPQFVC